MRLPKEDCAICKILASIFALFRRSEEEVGGGKREIGLRGGKLPAL